MIRALIVGRTTTAMAHRRYEWPDHPFMMTAFTNRIIDCRGAYPLRCSNHGCTCPSAVSRRLGLMSACQHHRLLSSSSSIILSDAALEMSQRVHPHPHCSTSTSSSTITADRDESACAESFAATTSSTPTSTPTLLSSSTAASRRQQQQQQQNRTNRLENGRQSSRGPSLSSQQEEHRRQQRDPRPALGGTIHRQPLPPRTQSDPQAVLRQRMMALPPPPPRPSLSSSSIPTTTIPATIHPLPLSTNALQPRSSMPATSNSSQTDSSDALLFSHSLQQQKRLAQLSSPDAVTLRSMQSLDRFLASSAGAHATAPVASPLPPFHQPSSASRLNPAVRLRANNEQQHLNQATSQFFEQHRDQPPPSRATTRTNNNNNTLLSSFVSPQTTTTLSSLPRPASGQPMRSAFEPQGGVTATTGNSLAAGLRSTLQRRKQEQKQEQQQPSSSSVLLRDTTQGRVMNHTIGSSGNNRQRWKSISNRRSPNAHQPEQQTFVSPLSEFIRRIQLQHAEERAKQKSAPTENNKNSSNLNGSLDPLSDKQQPLPKWRLQGGERVRYPHRPAARSGPDIHSTHAMREMRRRNRLNKNHHSRFRRDHIPQPLQHFFPEDRQEQLQHGMDAASKPAFVDPKDQLITIPPYPISLADASLLLREKTSTIKNLLKCQGEYPIAAKSELATKSSNSNKSNGLSASSVIADEDLILDPDVLELIALELNVNFERSSRRRLPLTSTDDQDRLMQRRNAATAITGELVFDAKEQVRDTDTQQEQIENAIEQGNVDAATRYESLPSRPPVVCIMGHVDHGKTTLMDTLRRRAHEAANNSGTSGGKSSSKKKAKKNNGSPNNGDGIQNVAGTEAGGITQVISAFQVPLLDPSSSLSPQKVTFLDTPGHAAFKAMRQSGSDAADIIVLVVAADDGIAAQTVEILNFYKSIAKGSNGTGISLVVAMNKIDKAGINVDEARIRIESQLLEHGILAEGMPTSNSSRHEYGPPVQVIPVSGLTGQGIDDLMEGLILQSDVMDLRADTTAGAEGIVMDAGIEKGLGVVADCIVRWGSIQKGDVVVSGTHMGKVKILKDVHGHQIKQGLPSQPVRIIGFDTIPKAGDPFFSVASEQVAEDLVTRRKALIDSESSETALIPNDIELQSAGNHFMNNLWKERLEQKCGINRSNNMEDAPIRIPVIVKADADGTLAAIRECVQRIASETRHNIVIDLVKTGIGPVLATEVQTAKECNASIICFNIKNEPTITKVAEDEGVSVLRSNIIYALLDAVKEEFSKYLPAIPVETVHGKAKVQAVYEIGGLDHRVAGLQVIEGVLHKEKIKSQSGDLKCQFRIFRNGQMVHEKPLSATSLKHFKEDVDMVARGKECGLALDGFSDFQSDDMIECYSIDMQQQKM